MLSMKLQRVGRKKLPMYRVIVTQKHKDPYGDHVDSVGTYNPHDKENGLVLKEDKIKSWLEKGVQPTNTVYNLLVKAGIVKGEAKKSVFISKKRKTKIDDKKVAEVEKKKVEVETKTTEEKVVEPVVEKPVEALKVEEAPAEIKIEEAPEASAEVKAE